MKKQTFPHPKYNSLFIPDNIEETLALSRTTHLAIGAHQDDLEIFAYAAIEECYENDALWFGGVTVTDGGGSARTGPYGQFSDEEMKAVRHQEQINAAEMGQYSFQIQLGAPSSTIKDKAQAAQVVEQLTDILLRTQPTDLYLHNPADKHDSHIALLLRSIEAIHKLPPANRPKRIYGCEVWRDLDWVPDAFKIALPTNKHPGLARKLIDVFDSQISGGKNYTEATLGRRLANATFYQSHQTDSVDSLTFAIDLSPLIATPEIPITDLIQSLLSAFQKDVTQRIAAFD